MSSVTNYGGVFVFRIRHSKHGCLPKEKQAGSAGRASRKKRLEAPVSYCLLCGGGRAGQGEPGLFKPTGSPHSLRLAHCVYMS